MTLGVRVLVHDEATNSVFLIRHTYVPGWQLPGGGVETGETVEDAMARELHEEGNLRLSGPAELKSVHFNRHASRRDHVLLYVARDYIQDHPKAPDREIAEASFFPVNELPPETTAGTRRRIAEVLRGAKVSSDW